MNIGTHGSDPEPRIYIQYGHIHLYLTCSEADRIAAVILAQSTESWAWVGNREVLHLTVSRAGDDVAVHWEHGTLYTYRSSALLLDEVGRYAMASYLLGHSDAAYMAHAETGGA